MSIQVPRGSLDDELAVVSDEIAAQSTPVYLPKLFLKAGLETIRRIEKQQHLMVEPRVGFDLARAALTIAHAESRGIATHADIVAALPPAIFLNTSAALEADLAQFVFENLPNIARYLQNQIPGCDFPGIITKIHATCGLSADINPENIKQALLAESHFEEMESLCRWVISNEKIQNFRIYEVISEYLKAYTEGIASEIQARSRKFQK